jgi:hypothetical protein
MPTPVIEVVAELQMLTEIEEQKAALTSTTTAVQLAEVSLSLA